MAQITCDQPANMATPVGPVFGSLRSMRMLGKPPGGGASCKMGRSLMLRKGESQMGLHGKMSTHLLIPEPPRTTDSVILFIRLYIPLDDLSRESICRSCPTLAHTHTHTHTRGTPALGAHPQPHPHPHSGTRSFDFLTHLKEIP